MKAGRLLRLLDRPLLRLKLGPELPLGFKPVTDIVTMNTTARDVDFESAVGDLEVGRLPFHQSDLSQ